MSGKLATLAGLVEALLSKTRCDKYRAFRSKVFIAEVLRRAGEHLVSKTLLHRQLLLLARIAAHVRRRFTKPALGSGRACRARLHSIRCSVSNQQKIRLD